MFKQYFNGGLVCKNSGTHPCTFQDQVRPPRGYYAATMEVLVVF